MIPVWNQWQFTNACLESLRPTLGARDEVIVVDNGSEDETARSLRQFPWARVITNETNRGFAKACNQGAAAASGDIVIFLNNDTLVPSHWIDGLVKPFDDANVAATGPMSNAVSGPQMVDNASYEMGNMASFKRFAKQWREQHKGETTEFPRLVGFCLAVRRSAFHAINGFDESFETGGAEDDDLCIRLINNDGKLLICHESFVHHHGHATFDGNGLDWFAIQEKNVERFKAKHNVQIRPETAHEGPFISACMIMKDEIDNIERCLASLSGVVDEVVIYDTGSTDGSIEKAREMGAIVLEGYWDDDFARARNAALDACNGEWILAIDADEEYTGDIRKFRQALMHCALGALQVEIINIADKERDQLTHRPCRLFKKAQFHWVGRLHEQVTTRSGAPRVEAGVAQHACLLHYGYMQAEMERKNKAERNIRIAQMEIDDADETIDLVDKLTNLGRSYSLVNNFDEALSLFARAKSFTTKSPVVMRTLCRTASQTATTATRYNEGLQWADELERWCEHDDVPRFLRSAAHIGLGQWNEALNDLDGLEQLRDDDGVNFPMCLLHARRGIALAQLERYEEAASTFDEALEYEALDELIWSLAIEAYWHVGRNFRELCAHIPADNTAKILSHLVNVTPEAADAVLEDLFEEPERQSNILALAIRIAPKLSNERALEWSVRMRKFGLDVHCPIVARAWSPSVPPRDRLRAIAYLHVAFQDRSAIEVLSAVANAIECHEFSDVIYELNEIDAELLEPFIIGAATSIERGLALAQALHRFEATDEAVAVLEYACENLRQNGIPSDADKLAEQAGLWLTSIGRTEEAVHIREVVSASMRP